MTFTKYGTPQPLSVINGCVVCGKPSKVVYKDKPYCEEHIPEMPKPQYQADEE